MTSDRRDVRVNDVDLSVVQAGSGSPALVFLHYWGGSSRTWAPVVARLSPTNRCVAIDFRGWGRSDKGAADHDLQTLADDVIGIVDELGLERFVIVGHSMGGKVAQLVAARRPQGLERLILIAPAPPVPLDTPEEQRRAMLASYQTREGAEMVIGILSARPLSDACREQIIEDTLAGAPAAKRAWPEQGMTQDISEAAAGITAPVVVIVGDADKVEPEASLRAAFGAVLPTAKFIVLPGTGHLGPLESAADVTDAVRVALADASRV